MNNKYKIIVGQPLLRPGITLETEVSEGYIEPVMDKIMEKVRNINKNEESKANNRRIDLINSLRR